MEQRDGATCLIGESAPDAANSHTTAAAVLAALTACEDQLDQVAGLDRSGWTPADRMEALDQIVRIGRRVDGLKTLVAAEAERLGAAFRTEGRDTVSHLAATQQMSPRQAAGLVKQGTALNRFDVLGAACATGQMSLTQAKACADRLETFPADLLGDAALGRAQQELAVKAAHLGATELRTEARRIVDQALTACGADPQEQAEADHRQAVNERHIWFKDEGASIRFGGQLPTIDGERWRDTLTAVARQASRRPGGAEPNPDGTTPSRAASMIDAQLTLIDQATQANTSGDTDRNRDADARSGIRDDDQAAPPARTWPQVSVLIDGAALDTGVLRGVSETSGQPLASTVLASILCDCEARGIITGANGEPLDVGRAHRFVPPPIRRALAIRDGGCMFPGCDEPPSNTHAHHLIPWWADGPTALENLASVCRRHHLIVEPARESRDGTLPDKDGWDDPTRWRLIINPDDRLPRAVPPARVDPTRTPILHARLQTRLKTSGPAVSAVLH